LAIDKRRMAMKGLVYGGPGARSWTELPDSGIQDPRDATIRVDEFAGAYDVFAGPVRTGALQVVLSR
jgi:hypothetical protein